jgi:hypothetical protein
MDTFGDSVLHGLGWGSFATQCCRLINKNNSLSRGVDLIHPSTIFFPKFK